MNSKTLLWTPGRARELAEEIERGMREAQGAQSVPSAPQTPRTPYVRHQSGFLSKADVVVSPVSSDPPSPRPSSYGPAPVAYGPPPGIHDADDTLVMSRSQVAALVASPYGPPPPPPPAVGLAPMPVPLAPTPAAAMLVPLAAIPPAPASIPPSPVANEVTPEGPKEVSGTQPRTFREVLEPQRPAPASGVNRAVVAVYKVFGFAVLGAILLGLASFLFSHLFYLFDHRWTTPLVLSSTDPRVLQIDAQRESAKASRDALAQQRLELVARLQDAQRTVASEESFQASFDDMMQASLADQSAELAAFQRLLGDLERTRRDVTASNKEYADLSGDELKKQYDARLIDVDQKAKGGVEIAQLAGTNVALHAKNVEVDARITELRRTVRSLKTGGVQTSYEVLHMRHEHDQSRLASQKAADEAKALEQSVAMMDKTIAEYDGQIARIAKAPYMLAADANVSTAFVPYENIEAVKLGDDVYACAVSVFVCRKIGRVAELLDGEVLGRHPLQNRDMRGVLVRLSLDEPEAIERPVLHLKRAPLGF